MPPDVALVTGSVIERPLGKDRVVALRMFGMGMGGGMATALWKSPKGAFEVAAILFVPLHDEPLTQAARAFMDARELTRTLEAFASGVDQALWPPR